jgi:hypothetical protein
MKIYFKQYKEDELYWACGTHGRREKCRHGLSLLGKCRHRWEDNIKMVLKETGWQGVDCMHIAEDRDDQ